MPPMIRIEQLGKRYRLRRSDDGLRHMLQGLMTHPIRTIREKCNRESFWALQDVSLDVDEGEVLGIVGLNGAGKSTLLKVLSRITDPTRGRVLLRGTVSSLLEVGTGFHTELSGRENIYLNGAILGMTRAEITKKFDAIVEFSGVEKFLDMPIKRYSSGMQVRLAFAVAAHLEPEILLIDEVLAVGDYRFQEKCLGKMKDVAGRGRTVFFVSHNLNHIQSLCTRCIWLKDGQVAADGAPADVVKNYLGLLDRQESTRQGPWTADGATLLQIESIDKNGQARDTFNWSESFTFRLRYRLDHDEPGFFAVVRIFHPEYGMVFLVRNIDLALQQPLTEAGCYECELDVPSNLLNEGEYSGTVALVRNLCEPILTAESIVTFSVFDDQKPIPWRVGGIVRPAFTSRTRRIDSA